MIRFRPIPEPPTFDHNARSPGNDWLASHPNPKRPKDFWSPFKGHLADGFNSLCAYSAMYEPVGTVDHFVSWNEDPSKAYEWNNYRYSSGWINSSKQHVPSSRILDPFEVEDGWFEIHLPSLQLVLSDSIPDEYRARAEYVLERLHLRDDERVMRQRRSWMEAYEQGMSIDELERRAPLLARAVRNREANRPQL